MLSPLEIRLKEVLSNRQKEGALRELKQLEGMVDFSSNDYFGFAIDGDGSGGSRLLSGNTRLHEEFEAFVARYHRSEAALLFNSGYSANLGVLSCAPQKGDVILYDQLVHASIRDGIRLSNANAYKFAHNDLEELKTKLDKFSDKRIFVVVESVYSMDGDLAPMVDMVNLITTYDDVNLIVDEAHACGVFGERGEGLVVELGLEEEVFCRVVTYGKAFGRHGAVVLGSKVLRDYLINFSRPFIYTTSMPKSAINSLITVYDKMSKSKSNQLFIRYLVSLFKALIDGVGSVGVVVSDSAIQTVILGSNERAKTVALGLQEKGFDVRPILSPTVEKGKERIRICLHDFNTKQEVSDLVSAIKSLI